MRHQDGQSWTRWPPRLLDGKTVGIYGVGLIAEALAPRCEALGMDVIGFTSTRRALPGFDRMHLRSELLEVAGRLDYLVLLVPYAEDTRHIIDARVFQAMKRTGYLVNLARGGIVDEGALIRALEAGEIAGAALDVFQEEPLPASHPLWTTRERYHHPAHGRLLRRLRRARLADDRAQHGVLPARQCRRDDQRGAEMSQRAAPTAITRFPYSSTSSASPGISTVVEACSSTSAGPLMRLPASSAARA